MGLSRTYGGVTDESRSADDDILGIGTCWNVLVSPPTLFTVLDWEDIIGSNRDWVCIIFFSEAVDDDKERYGEYASFAELAATYLRRAGGVCCVPRALADITFDCCLI